MIFVESINDTLDVLNGKFGYVLESTRFFLMNPLKNFRSVGLVSVVLETPTLGLKSQGILRGPLKLHSGLTLGDQNFPITFFRF